MKKLYDRSKSIEEIEIEMEITLLLKTARNFLNRKLFEESLAKYMETLIYSPDNKEAMTGERESYKGIFNQTTDLLKKTKICEEISHRAIESGKKKLFDLAIFQCDTVINLNSSYKTPYHTKGVAYIKMHKTNEAIMCFKQFRDLALTTPNNEMAKQAYIILKSAYLYSASILHNEKDYKGALEYYNQAIDFDRACEYDKKTLEGIYESYVSFINASYTNYNEYCKIVSKYYERIKGIDSEMQFSTETLNKIKLCEQNLSGNHEFNCFTQEFPSDLIELHNDHNSNENIKSCIPNNQESWEFFK